MKFTKIFSTALLVSLVLACGDKEEEVSSSMEGMSAEEHAMMMAGGAAESVDESGNTTREAVMLSTDELRTLGVVFTPVTRDSLTRTIRTVGHISAAEPRIGEVTTKIEGFVEVLHVNYTGQRVRRGQHLLQLYSPALVAAQEELLTAKSLVDRLGETQGTPRDNAETLLAAARRRLTYWDIPEAAIAQIESTGTVSKTLPLVAPMSGIVLEKNVVEGQRIVPGQRLYRLADLRQVWVEGEIFEQDIGVIRNGSAAHIEVAAYPGEHLMGQVSFVHPTVDEMSRTTRVRIVVDNGDGRLKPGMFATVFFDVSAGNDVLTVPSTAILATGERNLVFMRMPDGMLHATEVVIGARARDLVQIIDGLMEGDMVVSSANFLVDAESRLARSGGGMPGMQHGEDSGAVEVGDSVPAAPTEMEGHNND